MVNLLLLGVVGNFVTNPGESFCCSQTALTACEKPSALITLLSGDPALSASNTASAVPSVVVDTYTGRLVVRMPYDAIRGYFIEALLVISIIVITRLSFVRNVTYKITLPATTAAAAAIQQQKTVAPRTDTNSK